MVILGQEQTIFKKVALSEKKKLFRELAQKQIQLLVKSLDGDETFNVVATNMRREEALLCSHSVDLTNPINDQKVISSFSFEDERYYFHTELSFEAGWAVLKINMDLFQLQRRANARIEIPADYEAGFVLTSHAGRSFFIDCQVENISAGGLRLNFLGDTLHQVNIGDRLTGTLRLGRRRPFDFEMEVRFSQKSAENGSVKQILGVQFLNRNQALENRLFLMMIDLQRELYLKYSDESR